MKTPWCLGVGSSRNYYPWLGPGHTTNPEINRRTFESFDRSEEETPDYELSTSCTYECDPRYSFSASDRACDNLRRIASFTLMNIQADQSLGGTTFARRQYAQVTPTPVQLGFDVGINNIDEELTTSSTSVKFFRSVRMNESNDGVPTDGEST